jgi:hypothetical protein
MQTAFLAAIDCQSALIRLADTSGDEAKSIMSSRTRIPNQGAKTRPAQELPQCCTGKVLMACYPFPSFNGSAPVTLAHHESQERNDLARSRDANRKLAQAF